jgi:hypothetical protein
MQPNYSILSLSLSAAAALSVASPARAEEAASAPPNPPAEVASLDPSTVPPTPGAQGTAPAAPPPSGDTLAPAPVNPPPSPARTLDNTLSAFAVFDYGYSGLGAAPGVGLRFQKRIVRDLGLKGPKVHDELAIEAGLDYVHYSWSLAAYPEYNWSYNEFSILAGVVYNFWLSDSFTLYPKVELAYAFGHTSSYSGVVSPSYGGLWFQGAAGAAYKFGPVSLRGELGWRAVRLGAGFTF